MEDIFYLTFYYVFLSLKSKFKRYFQKAIRCLTFYIFCILSWCMHIFTLLVFYAKLFNIPNCNLMFQLELHTLPFITDLWDAIKQLKYWLCLKKKNLLKYVAFEKAMERKDLAKKFPSFFLSFLSSFPVKSFYYFSNFLLCFSPAHIKRYYLKNLKDIELYRKKNGKTFNFNI